MNSSKYIYGQRDNPAELLEVEAPSPWRPGPWLGSPEVVLLRAPGGHDLRVDLALGLLFAAEVRLQDLHRPRVDLSVFVVLQLCTYIQQ